MNVWVILEPPPPLIRQSILSSSIIISSHLFCETLFKVGTFQNDLVKLFLKWIAVFRSILYFTKGESPKNLMQKNKKIKQYNNFEGKMSLQKRILELLGLLGGCAFIGMCILRYFYSFCIDFLVFSPVSYFLCMEW